MSNREYDYMIKTINEDGTSFGGFQYPLKKGAKVVASDWNSKPVCGGGIHGLVHYTRNHYIQSNSLWIILKYRKGTEVVVGDEKIKVPYAWVVAWGTAQEIQQKYSELTGKPYVYSYAIQIAGEESTQIAGEESTQIAESWSTQTAGAQSTQTAGYGSTQTAGARSTQTAGYGSTQTAGYGSTQTAGEESTQTAEHESTQTAGARSTQTAGYGSTQTAGDGSVSIIRGKEGYCQHKGKVLQVMVVWDGEASEYIYLTKIISDKKKHRLTAIKEKGKWVLEDEVIEAE